MIRSPKNRFQPAVDRLDPRRLMAAHVTASLAKGVLTVRGTAAADVIAVNVQSDPGGVVSVFGVNKVFPSGKVNRVVVLGGKGDDNIAVAASGSRTIGIRIDGGAGHNTINGVPDFSTAVAATTATAASAPTIAPAPAPAAVSIAASSTPSTSAISAAEQRIIDLINAQRVQAGLSALSVSPTLTEAADVQSADMAQLGIMSHVLPGTVAPTLADRAAYVKYNYSTMGENIAYNYADADAVVAGWMNSPEHKANILNPNFVETGVSIAYSAAGEPYYTQEFGRQMGT